KPEGASQCACRTAQPGYSSKSSSAGYALGTKIISDGWKAYQGLANDPDYEWDWANHSKNFLNPDNPEVHAQTIESMWRPLKVRRQRNGSPPLYNDSYLSEGLWQMNVKDAGQDPFFAIVNDIMSYWKPGKIEAEPF
ncbi:Transposase, partial [Aphelenchoides avenae]